MVVVLIFSGQRGDTLLPAEVRNVTLYLLFLLNLLREIC